MSFDKPAVVLDNGSYNIKAGFSCDNHPVSIFRTLVGRPNYLQGSYGREYYDVHIGDDAYAKIEELELSKPVVEGRIVHWDNMERIWHHVFYRELKVAPEDRAVVLGCSSKTPMDEKIKCCEVFFETLNAPALCVQSQGVLSLYGSGYTTGLSVDLGYDTVDINPVYEGGLISYAHIETLLAGAQVSAYIKQSLDDRNLSFGLKTPEVIKGIKRQIYVTQDIAMCRKDYRKTYTLPSGEEIDVSQEAFMTGELLFQPDSVMKVSDMARRKYTVSSGEMVPVASTEVFMGEELTYQSEMLGKLPTLSRKSMKNVPNDEISRGVLKATESTLDLVDFKTDFVPLHQAVVTAAMKCDAELWPDLFNAIVPCGGLATIPGLNDRLAMEVELQINKPVTVLSSPEPYTVAWLGGATFAGMSDAKKMWVQKKQYEEYGARIVRNKFL